MCKKKTQLFLLVISNNRNNNVSTEKKIHVMSHISPLE